MSQARSTQTERSSGLSAPVTSVHKVDADGVRVFYRAAGDPIPGSAAAARVPGFVFHVPRTHSASRQRLPRDRAGPPGFRIHGSSRRAGKYVYSFDRLAATLNAFTQALKIRRFALYVFDYGAPTGFVSRWLTPTASQPSFRRTATPMKKGWRCLGADPEILG
jgi:pimeloyl-ACP methyl ester carboxylesterase